MGMAAISSSCVIAGAIVGECLLLVVHLGAGGKGFGWGVVSVNICVRDMEVLMRGGGRGNVLCCVVFCFEWTYAYV